jgi:upstream activation factor subunit UAF30
LNFSLHARAKSGRWWPKFHEINISTCVQRFYFLSTEFKENQIMAAAKKPAAKPAAKKPAAKAPAAKAPAAKKPAAKAAAKPAAKKPAAKAPAAKAAAKPAAKAAPKAAAKPAAKKAAAKPAAAKRAPSAAFMKPMTPSALLAAVVGALPLPRTEVTKKVWDYIKKHSLQDAVNRRMINADANLRAIFGKAQVSMFEMTKLISNQLK